MKLINKTLISSFILCGGSIGTNAALTSNNSKKIDKAPNIVILFVDDLGWTDLGYQNPQLHTPHINQLKSEGLYLSRAYVSTATSSPSRASLLTGKEAVRTGFVRHIPDNPDRKEYHYLASDPAQMPSRNWLKLNETTYAERLHELGYKSLFLGKWHLGHEGYFPINQGFDEMYGTCEHGHPNSYYAPFFNTHNPLPNAKPGVDYITDMLTDKAVDYIDTYKGNKPFLLNMSYYTVHGPHVGRKDFLKQYQQEGIKVRAKNQPNITDPVYRKRLDNMDSSYPDFAAMVSALDESVGRIREALIKKGFDKNTMIIFTSDQGGTFTNAPLNGGKMGGFTDYEGGSRVPMIIYYPGMQAMGTEDQTPVETLDLYPTMVELASRKPCKEKQLNGESLLPLLEGETLAPRDLFLYRSYENQNDAIISGDWRLIKYRDGNCELFNIRQDEGQEHNLIARYPERAASLKTRLLEWEREAIPGELLLDEHAKGFTTGKKK